MIRMFQSKTSAHAKSYFRDALSKADYYINDQELNGTFNGKLAKQLNLNGEFIDKHTFEQLCDNINPKDGGSLTPRTVKDRRVGYDISFHCPKSVSILHALTDDDKVLEAFRTSVHETMNEMERDMQTRVRTQGQYDDRHSGNWMWTDFIHQTARPVKNFDPDPHLHCHCFTFNASNCDKEGRIKAGQFHNIKREMPYYQARFLKRLAQKLSDMGQDIRKTKNGFEVTVVPQKAIDHFSKRTNLIGKVAKEKGIVDPKELDELGARTREKKQSTLSMSELKEAWIKQLKESGIDETTPSEIKTTDYDLTNKKSIDHAISHVFTRASVKRERQILTEGYLHAIDNRSVTLDDIDIALKKDSRIFKIKSGNQMLCTTDLVLKEERKMVDLARIGLGKVKPFNNNYKPNKDLEYLGIEQVTALKHILTSGDCLTMIRGGAGTGKTTLIKHAVREIEKSSKEVFLFAPTSAAARDVLKKQGFDKSETVAKLLIDKELQRKTRGQVIWIDEAGMLGTKDMADILDIADKNKARVILSGDPRQHSAVDRGDAMRILKTVGRIPQASLETIYRQKATDYKSAVYQISKGNVLKGFKSLDEMGSIKEIDYENISKRLIKDYLKIADDKKSALVISPTKDQVRKVNKGIRDGLKERNIVKKREKTVSILDNLPLTNAQKLDSRSYSKGYVVQAHQNMKGIKRGEKNIVHSIKDNTVILNTVDGQIKPLPINNPKSFDVYRKREITLSKGDKIRITKNSFDESGKRLNNGSELIVSRIDKKGKITAFKRSKNKNTRFDLKSGFGNLDYAYSSTSYSSQGKTVDHVLVNQPSVTFPASNQKQFYVSTSRGTEGVTVYTDDKEALLNQIQKSGDRQGATELVTDDIRFMKTVDIKKELIKPVKGDLQKPDINYEPEV